MRSVNQSATGSETRYCSNQHCASIIGRLMQQADRIAPKKPHFPHSPTITVSFNTLSQHPDNPGLYAENASDYA